MDATPDAQLASEPRIALHVEPHLLTIEDIVVSSWAQLNDELFSEAKNPTLGRYRSRFAYRGMPNRAYGLTTSLARLGGSFTDVEKHLLRNFIKYARGETVMTRLEDLPWHWLALAQHHGLPTRLLDWTFSPYVALHFATVGGRDDQQAADGVVWCVDYVWTNKLLPKKLRKVLAREGSAVATGEMLGEVAGSLAKFDRLADAPFVVFFEPPSLDARIVNQAALFSLMSGAGSRLDAWLTERPDAVRRIVIPAALKQEVRDKLDQANINERVLFPGLDGLSRYMRRYYAPSAFDFTPLTEPDPASPEGRGEEQ